jgi:hypothetical protein
MSSSFNLHKPSPWDFCARIKELATGTATSSVPDITKVGLDIFVS